MRSFTSRCEIRRERDSVKESINPPTLPNPGRLNYSQVVKKGNMVFLTGMVPEGPDGILVGEDIRSQTRKCLENMHDAMKSAGGSLADICYVTAYLQEKVRDFEAYNEVYGEFFPTEKPARATIGATLDGILVEIQAIGVLD
jgi:2-iminobutanoate/2-iminopropanoate deaminase